MNKQPKIFVIVVTYKGMQWYDKCFTSLRESTMPIKTIVVDNTPGEEDANYIREHYPEILVMKPEQNLGFGKGNNLAMKYARENGADYVFLLNQDTWLLQKDMFARLVDISVKHPEYGILSPLHLQSDEKTIGMMMEIKTNVTSKAILVDMYKGELKEVYETNFVGAAAWLLPRYTLEVVGGFDPIYQHYEEDDDYLNRVMYHGMKIGLCPSLNLVHDHQESALPFAVDKWLYHRQQQLLVDLTNINRKKTIRRQLRYECRLYIRALMEGKFEECKWIKEDIRYICKKRSAIMNSRHVNTNDKHPWL